MSEVIECYGDKGEREYAAYEHGLDGNLYYYTEAAYQEWRDSKDNGELKCKLIAKIGVLSERTL